MKCEDCGFEYSETGACPHCGYDSSVDLMEAVRRPSPPVNNPLEVEFAAICKEAEEGKTSKARARQHWERISEQAKNGNRDARHLVARMALSQKDYPVALGMLEPLAKGGHALAQLDLGKMYDDGLGVDQDPFRAIRYFRMAAAQGNPIALFYLARHHLQGGVLNANANMANALMKALVAAHPTMFRTAGGCPCQPGLTNAEFAQKTASQITKMIKYLLWAVIIVIIVSIVRSELR